MTVSVIGPSVVRTSRGAGDWVVWAVEHAAGVARVEQRDALTEVVVADAPRSPDEHDPGFAAVACTVDGGALVICHAAPPALLVTPMGCRTAPADPGGRELVSVSPGERLLLLSSSVLEARPTALSRALQEPGAKLIDCNPVSLLAALFHEVHHGAGVVVGRPSAPPPTHGGDAR